MIMSGPAGRGSPTELRGMRTPGVTVYSAPRLARSASMTRSPVTSAPVTLTTDMTESHLFSASRSTITRTEGSPLRQNTLHRFVHVTGPSWLIMPHATDRFDCGSLRATTCPSPHFGSAQDACKWAARVGYPDFRSGSWGCLAHRASTDQPICHHNAHRLLSSVRAPINGCGARARGYPQVRGTALGR